MLKWFADRLAETGKDARKDERGFTLIELLVVVIIIGILAAIAIPTFLNQRENAENASVESDARNAATEAQSLATEEDGDYSAVDEGELQSAVDLSTGNTWGDYVPDGSDGFCLYIDGENQNVRYSTAENPRVDEGTCTTP